MAHTAMAPDRTGRQCLASSVWLPWTITALLLMSIAAAALGVGTGDERPGAVPRAFLDGQRSTTSTSAQAIRRNLNGGLHDLTAVARNLSDQRIVRGKELRRSLVDLRRLHGRYRTLYVTDRHGLVVAEVGSGRHPGALPARVTAPGMTHTVAAGGRQVIASFAPLAGPKGDRWVLAGEYDVRNLRAALAETDPASAWVVDDKGRALHPPTGAVPTEQDHAVLARAAQQASEAAGYDVEMGDAAAPEVVVWAPVQGAGPAGTLGLGVVSSSSLEELAVPAAPESP